MALNLEISVERGLTVFVILYMLYMKWLQMFLMF
jgi:hypothetical protein